MQIQVSLPYKKRLDIANFQSWGHFKNFGKNGHLTETGPNIKVLNNKKWSSK